MSSRSPACILADCLYKHFLPPRPPRFTAPRQVHSLPGVRERSKCCHGMTVVRQMLMNDLLVTIFFLSGFLTPFAGPGTFEQHFHCDNTIALSSFV
jgi:hypothetical protein